MQRRCAKPDDNAAENAHLERCYSEDLGGGVCGERGNASRSINQRANCGVHYQIADSARKRGDLLFLLRHSDSDSHCEKQREVVKDNATRLAHNVKHGVQQPALANDA